MNEFHCILYYEKLNKKNNLCSHAKEFHLSYIQF